MCSFKLSQVRLGPWLVRAVARRLCVGGPQVRFSEVRLGQVRLCNSHVNKYPKSSENVINCLKWIRFGQAGNSLKDKLSLIYISFYAPSQLQWELLQLSLQLQCELLRLNGELHDSKLKVNDSPWAEILHLQGEPSATK